MAKIKFTQGATTDLAGRAVVGTTGVVVNCSNDEGINARYVLEDVPHDSALVEGTAATATNTNLFTPDVIGGTYQVAMYDAVSGVLLDRRDFIVPTSGGEKIPAFKSTDNTFNYAGQAKGWKTAVNRLFRLLVTSAPASAQFLVLANDGTLTTERALVFNGSRFAVADGGANSNYTVDLAAGGITDTHVGAAAAIAGSKIAPNFGAQNVVTTGTGTFQTSVSITGATAGVSTSAASGTSVSNSAGVVILDGVGSLSFRISGSAKSILSATSHTFNIPGLTFERDAGAPVFSQSPQLSDVAPYNFTIQPQHAFATATLANRTPGSLIVNLGAPTNGGTAEAALVVRRNGTAHAFIGPNTGAAYSGVWLGPGIVPSATNFAFLSNGTTASFLNVDTGGTVYLSIASGNAGTVGVSAGGMSWSSLTSNPTLKQDDVATASATGNALTIQAQNATGTTSTGGKLALKSGTGTTSTGAVEVSTGSDLRFNLKAGGTSSLTLSITGTPEGAVTATPGSVITRSDGGAGTTLYVKESGSGNTGWVAYGGGASTGTTLTIRTTAGPVTLTGSGAARRNVHVNRYAGNITFNLPTSGRTVGESFVFKNGWVGAYTLTVNAGTGVGHDGPGTLETYDISEGTFAEFVWDGTHWNLMR